MEGVGLKVLLVDYLGENMGAGKGICSENMMFKSFELW